MKKAILYTILFSFFNNLNAQNADIKILKTINVNRNKNLDNAFIFITNSNDYVNFGTIGVFGAIGLINNNKELKYNAAKLLTAQMISLVATQATKKIVNRDRPFITYNFIQPYKPYSGNSFPSGHTSSAFANATTLSLMYKKWYVIAPSFTYASLVGYSRMHLGVHYPSDVLAGALIGAGSAYLTNYLYKIYIKKYNKTTTKTLHLQ